MKHFQHFFLLTPLLILVATMAHSQYCIPLNAIPYSPNMPGITRFKLGTIDRTSTDIEHYPQNSYVFTDLSTTLVADSSYTASITHTIDPAICPDMNLRIWIDYNQDKDFLDPGELVLSEDHDPAGTFENSFLVPNNVPTGITRLRCTAKMSSLGGHTLPTPCDIPTDPFGYHGEIEDYLVNIISDVSSTNAATNTEASLSVNPNPSFGDFNLLYTLKSQSITSISLFNLCGQIIEVLQAPEMASAGTHIRRQETAAFPPGLYLLRLQANETVVFQKLVVN